jgi:hypothetical protein
MASSTAKSTSVKIPYQCVELDDVCTHTRLIPIAAKEHIKTNSTREVQKRIPANASLDEDGEII